MILILFVALFGFVDCTSGSAVSGVYDEFRDLAENLKIAGEYGGQQYEQKKDNINSYNKGDGKNKGYNYNDRDGDKSDRDGYKKDGRGYLEDYKDYDGGQKYEDQKDNTGYGIRDGNRIGFDDKNDKRKNRGGYGEYYNGDKLDKYDGPEDYLISDKYRESDRDYPYDRNNRRLGSDLREYDYVEKCDEKEKDCKDGKDCYDKAKDRSGYNKCQDQYGNEYRYYDENNRYSGDRYRYDNERDRYGYEKGCFDDFKDRADYEKCLDRYDNNRNRYDSDKDCNDNTKDRSDYNKCRRYYRRCREYYRRDYRYSYNEQDWKNDRDCNYDEPNLVGLGKNDREDQLIRPCALDDRQCIRKYFAQNSKCKPAYGPIPDPLYLKRNTVYFPFANITLLRTRLRITGLSSIKINEFYVNKDTGNLVIALDFQNMNQSSPRVYFRYKRSSKESIVLSDFGFITYNSGTFTAVIPRVPHLRLELAEIHADIDDLIPRYVLGPRAVNSTDPQVATAFARLNSDLPTATQEFFLFQSQLLTAIYIQENICDFGIKLISV